MTFKVAPFVSSEFNSLDEDGKKEFIRRYNSWKAHDITEMYLEWLDKEYNRLLKEDEADLDLVSEFQFTSKLINNRAKRNILKQLINKI